MEKVRDPRHRGKSAEIYLKQNENERPKRGGCAGGPKEKVWVLKANLLVHGFDKVNPINGCETDEGRRQQATTEELFFPTP